jgi:hypothetical protein
MARREQITINNMVTEGVNIDQPVGPGPTAKNLQQDVMLIQAMFEKLAERAGPGFLGLGSWDDVPEPSGNFDDKTEKAIKSYQRKYLHQLLSADSNIHPGAFQGRNIRFNGADTPQMTITLLHIQLRGKYLFSAHPISYLTEIKRTVPQLRI